MVRLKETGALVIVGLFMGGVAEGSQLEKDSARQLQISTASNETVEPSTPKTSILEPGYEPYDCYDICEPEEGEDGVVDCYDGPFISKADIGRGSNKCLYSSMPIEVSDEIATLDTVSFNIVDTWSDVTIDSVSVSYISNATGELTCDEFNFLTSDFDGHLAKCEGGVTTVIVEIESSEFLHEAKGLSPNACAVTTPESGLCAYEFVVPCDKTMDCNYQPTPGPTVEPYIYIPPDQAPIPYAEPGATAPTNDGSPTTRTIDPPPTSNCTIYSDKQETIIDILGSQVLENTLHLDGGELRYGNAGIIDGKSIDLVVTVTSGTYTDIAGVWEERGKIPSEQNGKQPSSKFGNINMQTVRDKPKSGEGNFKMCFHDSNTDELVKAEKFYWTVYDMDERGDDVSKNGIGQKEKLLMYVNSATTQYQLEPNTEVLVYCEDQSSTPCAADVRTIFHSSQPGTAKDNPMDILPENLTDVQKGRAVEFTFVDTDCWEFTFDHYCPTEQPDGTYPLGFDPANNGGVTDGSCRGYFGGNFLFSGRAPEMVEEGECNPSPPVPSTPTTSPEKRSNPSPAPFEKGRSVPTVPTEPICSDECVCVAETEGSTEFPLPIEDCVQIVSQDTSTVTVDLYQTWTDSNIENYFFIYQESTYNQTCYVDEGVGPGKIGTKVLECYELVPKAVLKICIADALAGGLLNAQDTATLPKCCEPNSEELPSETGVVCYTLEVSCDSTCSDETAIGRLLRGT